MLIRSGRLSYGLTLCTICKHTDHDQRKRQSEMKLLRVASVFLGLVLSASGVPCNLEFGVRLDDGRPMPHGAILKDGVMFTPGDYKIIDGVRIGCICKFKVCVRKCCPAGEYMANRTCQSAEDPFVMPMDVAPRADDFFFLPGNECRSQQTRTLLDPASDSIQRFRLEDDGRLMIVSSQTYYQPKDYCVDHIDDQDEPKALVCDFQHSEIIATNIIGMVVSMPFLLATFIVYAILPDRNLHKKALMCYVITLFGAYLLMTIMQLHPTYFEVPVCKTLALFCLFFFMVSFFWMNVMSIDMWWTFSGLRGFSRNRKRTGNQRFVIYSAYAWGAPLLLVILVTCLTFSEDIPIDAWYHPGIGDGLCWFREKSATVLYFYAPLAVLILSNVILFCITAWNIKKVQKETAILKRSDSQRHGYERDKQRFTLYLKLMLAMGINWSTEIISWMVNWQVTQVPQSVWYLTDFCNAAYGMFIFFIFVFKRSTWNLLKKRYYIFTGRPHLARTIVVPHESATSIENRSGKLQKIPIAEFVNGSVQTSEGA